ncbi:MAG: hypothetical protein LM568_01435 [Desulfurococcaceae archaeon]|nr:hypothetical protein [Desulfurococcaceae archaeon]
MDIYIIQRILSALPNTINKDKDVKKVFVLSDTCPHCNEYIQRSETKEFLKSTDFAKVVFNPYLYAADAKDLYIIKRIPKIDTPTLIDLSNLEVGNVPEKPIEWIKHYVDVGLRPVIGRTRKRKTEETQEETTKKTRRRSTRKKTKFVEQKEEQKRVSKASNRCLEDICTEIP